MPPLIVYAQEPLPIETTKSIFLAGPTPRGSDGVSWRVDAIEQLETLGYDGYVFVPEPRDGKWAHGYGAQIEWEEEALHRADCIAFWVPRDMSGDTYGGCAMPALTTNDEWGSWKDSGKVVWGSPDWAEHTSYQKHYAKKLGVPGATTLLATLRNAIEKVGEGALRRGGECQVPLYIWRRPEFQGWLKMQYDVGNRLDGCRVVWTFMVPPVAFNTSGKPPRNLFLYALHVDVYIASEDRHKINEIVLLRPDITSVVLYRRDQNWLATKVALVKEFRSPVRNFRGMVLELPGGSSKEKEAIENVALHEVEEETGLKISVERLRFVGERQIAATLSGHTANVFCAELLPDEMALLEKMAADKVTHGVVEDSERTYIEVCRVADVLNRSSVDWSMVGMIVTALAP